MKGLNLCEQYFFQCGLPVFQNECPKLIPKMAFGLVGEGSECFGFDDEISRDHDWGPGFCVWLDREVFEAHGEAIQKIYAGLPKTFAGFATRQKSEWGLNRIGVLETNLFYRRLIGTAGRPNSLKDWLYIPETAFAAATNGKVFQDKPGNFSNIRNGLAQGYPESVRRKKIAARCMVAGQAGQYNFVRSLQRKEIYAARQAEMKFLESILSLVFLLNNTYMPFYKWAHKAVQSLPVLGDVVFERISTLLMIADKRRKVDEIEKISWLVIQQLKKQGLSEGESDFLPDHGPFVQSTIENLELRNLNIMMG